VALPTGGSNFFGAGRYKPDQLTEAVGNKIIVQHQLINQMISCKVH